MSRVGLKPIQLPQGVEVDTAGDRVVVRGPKGELSYILPSNIAVQLEDGVLRVSRSTDSRVNRAMHGLVRSLVANMVEGVSKGFERDLEIVGVGYGAQQAGDKIVLRVGFSHSVEIVPPKGISLVAERANRIKVAGIDKELVGRVAAGIRKVRPPDIYKGKGIRYAGEELHLKSGKTMGKKK